MQCFEPDGVEFQARDCVDGILINPVLPASFDSLMDNWRLWARRAYIRTVAIEDLDAEVAARTDFLAEAERRCWPARRAGWLERNPEGIRCDVFCEGTPMESFSTMAEAVRCAKAGPPAFRRCIWFW